MASEGPAVARVRVLVVEDDTAIRRLVARALVDDGVEVVEAGEGRAALAALEADPAGLRVLVCDLSLPGMAGEQVIRDARARRPDLAVVVMTGWDPASVAEALGGVGPIAVLSKPFSIAEVRAAVRAALPR